MKTLLIVLLVLIAVPVFAQSNDLQKVKDALVNQVLYTQALEQENVNLKTNLQRIADDLKLIKTAEQLDSLKKSYGIAVGPKKVVEPKKKEGK